MEIKISSFDYTPSVKKILSLIANPDIVREHCGGFLPPEINIKNRVLKKAVRDVKVGRCSLVCTEWNADNGDLMFFVIYDHSRNERRTAFTGGVVVAMGLKEIPFNNVMEGKAAAETAMAIYHYARSFKSYKCSAGR